MTKYYTITNREDNARIGTLNISNEKIKTPFLIDDNESTLNICNIGSIWSFQEIEKELDEIIMNIHK